MTNQVSEAIGHALSPHTMSYSRNSNVSTNPDQPAHPIIAPPQHVIETLVPPHRRRYAKRTFRRFATAFNASLGRVEYLYQCQENPFVDPDGNVDLSGAKGGGDSGNSVMDLETPVSFSLPSMLFGENDAPGLCCLQILNFLADAHNKLLTDMGLTGFEGGGGARGRGRGRGRGAVEITAVAVATTGDATAAAPADDPATDRKPSASGTTAGVAVAQNLTAATVAAAAGGDAAGGPVIPTTLETPLDVVRRQVSHMLDLMLSAFIGTYRCTWVNSVCMFCGIIQIDFIAHIPTRTAQPTFAVDYVRP